jgi:hypothetical protein
MLRLAEVRVTLDERYEPRAKVGQRPPGRNSRPMGLSFSAGLTPATACAGRAAMSTVHVAQVTRRHAAEVDGGPPGPGGHIKLQTVFR